MIDRSQYEWEYAPPADELAERWSANVPTGSEIESFFLNELCESSEHEYFLCVSDVFLDAIKRQDPSDQFFSLAVIIGRLLNAAEFARGVSDSELVDHFQHALRGFLRLYYDTSAFDMDGEERRRRYIRVGYLTLRAILMCDLPLARVILHSEREIECTNPKCDNLTEIRCAECGEYITPYKFHQRHHNMRNAPNHPAHDDPVYNHRLKDDD